MALWLTHHYEEDHERCVRIAGQVVCRRCATLYPTVIAVAVAAGLLWPRPTSALEAAIWITVAPMTFEWVLETRRVISYSPQRQSVVSLIAGIGGGIALAWHCRQPFAAEAVIPIAVAATICLVSTTIGLRRIS